MSSSSPPSPSPPDTVFPQTSDIDKLPPRPAPTSAYAWNEWSANARMIYLRDSDEANRYLSQLQPGSIGFDLEWKPNYYKGAKENPVALVQLANDNMIFLVQVSAMREFPSKLREILEDPAFTKTGVGIQGDTKKLFIDCGVSVRSCVDLSLLARTVDNARWKGKYNSSIGLARLVEVYCYRLLGKGKITRSNWENNLVPAQQLYASNDAHAGFTLYKKLAAMIDPSQPPATKYYTFDCIRGYYCEPLGLPWSPVNPNYDPGPPPPPRPRKDVPKQSQSEETADVQDETAPVAYEDPRVSVQRYESVLKLAHSTWVRQRDASVANQDIRSNQHRHYSSTGYLPSRNASYQHHTRQYSNPGSPPNSAGPSSAQGPLTSPNPSANRSRGVNRRHFNPPNPAATSANNSIQAQQQQSPPTSPPPSVNLRTDRPRPRYHRRPKPSTPQPAAV